MASQAVKVSGDGTLSIPQEFRRKLGIETGGTVMVELVGDGLRVHSMADAVREAQAIVRTFSSGDVSLSDALIAERRAEALRE